MRHEMPPPGLGMREGHLGGCPELPSLTHEGEPLAFSSSPGPTPTAFFTWASAFVPEAQMGTRQGAIWSSPKTLKPHPQCLACHTTITPSSLPPGSLSAFTVCQLGSLNTLHTESQPAKRGDPGAPSPASLFLWVGGLWGGKKSVSPPAKSDHAIAALQSMVSPGP